jgi:hypothetical protein
MKIDIESFASANGVKATGSPTTTLRQDIVRSLGGNTSYPYTLSKIVLVDTGGSERDYASISPTDWSFTSVANGCKATATFQIQGTASYTCNKIRMYGSTSLYFEYTLPSSITVTSTTIVTVTVTIQVTASITHGSGGEDVTTTMLTTLGEYIVKSICTNSYKGYRPDVIALYYGTTLITTITGSISTDLTYVKVTVDWSWAPTSTTTINTYQYRFEDGSPIAEVSFLPLDLGGGLTHTWRLTISL